MMSMVQEFLRVQRLRDEDMLQELRGMRTSLQSGQEVESPRLELPTPAAQRSS